MARRTLSALFLLLILGSGSREARASTIGIAEPNNTPAAAQNVDAYFSLAYSPDIGDVYGVNTSLTIPHVTIDATGLHAQGALEYDWYEFTVSAGMIGMFDIDYGMDEAVIESINPPGWLRVEFRLLDPSGNQMGIVQPFDRLTAGAGGSVNGADPFFQMLFGVGGTYRLGVGAGPYAFVDFFDSAENPFGANPDYQLQISLQGHEYSIEEASAVPEPATLVLLGAGLVGVIGARRRRQA